MRRAAPLIDVCWLKRRNTHREAAGTGDMRRCYAVLCYAVLLRPLPHSSVAPGQRLPAFRQGHQASRNLTRSSVTNASSVVEPRRYSSLRRFRFVPSQARRVRERQNASESLETLVLGGNQSTDDLFQSSMVTIHPTCRQDYTTTQKMKIATNQRLPRPIGASSLL